MSPDSIATSIGLDLFSTEGIGIGGVIKSRIEDFRVVEQADIPAVDEKGRFTVVKATLTNWETNRFVNRFARELKISRKRIWFSGTKDKRAVTTQLFVVDSPTKRVAETSIPDVQIEVLGRTHQKLKMGGHTSNRFSITVRGCADEGGNPMNEDEALAEVEKIVANMEERLGEGRFPNWVGPQRFGSMRPVTAVVGSHVVKGEWKEAIDTYLGMPGFRESEEVAAFRAEWRESGDVEKCLDIIPKHLGFEKNILESLLKKPGDYVAAYRRLPNNLQLMMVHAIQSLSFNHILRERLESGMPLATPVLGDVVGPITEEGKVEVSKAAVVRDETLARISRNCELGRLTVCASLTGRKENACEREVSKLEGQVLANLDLDEVTWVVEDIPRLSSSGTIRATTGIFSDFSFAKAASVDLSSQNARWKEGPQLGDRWHPEGACINFKFTLPPGNYATTLLREFTRAPLHQS